MLCWYKKQNLGSPLWLHLKCGGCFGWCYGEFIHMLHLVSWGSFYMYVCVWCVGVCVCVCVVCRCMCLSVFVYTEWKREGTTGERWRVAVPFFVVIAVQHHILAMYPRQYLKVCIISSQLHNIPWCALSLFSWSTLVNSLLFIYFYYK